MEFKFSSVLLQSHSLCLFLFLLWTFVFLSLSTHTHTHTHTHVGMHAQKEDRKGTQKVHSDYLWLIAAHVILSSFMSFYILSMF